MCIGMLEATAVAVHPASTHTLTHLLRYTCTQIFAYEIYYAKNKPRFKSKRQRKSQKRMKEREREREARVKIRPNLETPAASA